MKLNWKPDSGDRASRPIGWVLRDVAIAPGRFEDHAQALQIGIDRLRTDPLGLLMAEAQKVVGRVTIMQNFLGTADGIAHFRLRLRRHPRPPVE